MKIGELADATGTPVVSVRFYEQQGLLPIPARTSSNYRIYGGEHVDRLAFQGGPRCRLGEGDV